MTKYEKIKKDIETRLGLVSLGVKTNKGDYDYFMGYILGVWRYDVITEEEYELLKELVNKIYKEGM